MFITLAPAEVVLRWRTAPPLAPARGEALPLPALGDRPTVVALAAGPGLKIRRFYGVRG